MNYSRNTKRKKKIRIRIIIFIIGLLIGYISGEIFTKEDESLTKVEAIAIIEPTIQQPVIEKLEVPEHIKLLDEYTITAYCSCEICTGEWALNRPEGIVYGAAGIELQEGVSVASPLPLGSELIIDGHDYIVQDRTADWIAEKYNDKIIDVYFQNHDDAIEFGKQVHDVYIKIK